MGIELTAASIAALAPTASALSEALAIVRDGLLRDPRQTEDGTLVWASVQDSARGPFRPSADLAEHPERPVFRCTCAARVRPCKHGLALLLARVGGEPFAASSAPTDLLATRATPLLNLADGALPKSPKPESPERRAARETRAEATRRAAASKKIAQQREALDVLERFVLDLVEAGLGALGPKSAKAIDEAPTRCCGSCSTRRRRATPTRRRRSARRAPRRASPSRAVTTPSCARATPWHGGTRGSRSR
jgi:hypothetical protein